MKPDLQLLDGQFTIHRLDPAAEIPTAVLQGNFCWTARTPEEVSLVCPQHIDVAAQKSDLGWSCIKVMGPLEFDMTGIIATLSATLADAGISIFAISTFDPDYLLIKTADSLKACDALTENAYVFVTGQEC